MKALRFWLCAILAGLHLTNVQAALYPPSSSTPSVVRQVEGAVTDVGSGSTSETIVWETTLPALTANAEVELPYRYTGSGTGNKQWRIRIGGTTGADGTQLWSFGTTNAVGRLTPGFVNLDATNSQVGVSGNLGSAYGTTTTNHSTSAVETNSAGVRVVLTVTKTNGADVVTLQGAQLRVYQ